MCFIIAAFYCQMMINYVHHYEHTQNLIDFEWSHRKILVILIKSLLMYFLPLKGNQCTYRILVTRKGDVTCPRFCKNELWMQLCSSLIVLSGQSRGTSVWRHKVQKLHVFSTNILGGHKWPVQICHPWKFEKFTCINSITFTLYNHFYIVKSPDL
jgi:hypothetical protein